MSNKVYKNLYLIFNVSLLLLGVITLFLADGGFEQFALYANENSHNLLEDIFHMILIIIYIYFIIKSLLNIVNKKQYNKKWKTVLCRILSVLLLVISTLVLINAGLSYMNHMSPFFLYDIQTCLFVIGVIITCISMVLSVNFLFKSKKEKFNKKDIIPLVTMLLFITLIIIIISTSPKHNNNNIWYEFNYVILMYYINFILVPIQLVNLYNLFNLKKIKKQNIKVPNMIEIKNVILGLLILYVAIFSGLFIKQSYQYNKKMNQEVNFEIKDYYEDFIKESRRKVLEYKTLSTTSEQLACLSEVDKMINISYKNQHPQVKTYIELIDEYYDYNKIDDGQYNYYQVLKVCKFRENNIDTSEINKKYMGNLAIIDESFTKSLMSYQINIDFQRPVGYDMLDGYYLTSKYLVDQALRERIIKNEIELIELVLQAVGDDYE